MKISELGEFAFISRIAPPFTQNLPLRVTGIGDDCAVLPWHDNTCQLVTTDMLIEDSHFIRSMIPPEDLGYKSLSVNLSDIAAMGGIPYSAFISIGIPSEVEVEWLDLFYEGLYSLAADKNVSLLGGDTTKSKKHLIINIVVLGTVKTSQVKFRSGAQGGDILCVTDFLGDSGGGLRVLLEELEQNETHQFLVDRHHRPRPHIEEGNWLAQQNDVHAMIDVSDGIDSDIHRIMECSKCGATVDLDKLPLSNALNHASEINGWDVHELAATAGEDYCLLCTVSAKSYPVIADKYKKEFKKELYSIGTINSGENELIYHKSGQKMKLAKHGFDHFGGDN
jgi:thiamine-monophosphate kinase